MDNWQECTRTCGGVVSRRLAVNTQMGLGHERFDADLKAWASDFRLSESNHRQFYGRWAPPAIASCDLGPAWLRPKQTDLVPDKGQFR